MMYRVKKLLLKDLENNGSQASIDLEADARFAHIIGDVTSEKIILEAIEQGQTGLPKDCIVLATRITDKRLRVLNGLVKLKLVKAYWSGTKLNGVKALGVNRVRIYMLSTSSILYTTIERRSKNYRY
jgi:hypothetical protein